MSDGELNEERRYWNGQNVFMVLAGGGVVIVPEHPIYGSILIFVGIAGFVYSLWGKSMIRRDLAWLAVILFTWGSVAYDYYDRHHRAGFDSTPGDQLPIIATKHFLNERVDIDSKHFDHCTFTNATLVYHGNGHFALANSEFFGSLRIQTDNESAANYFDLAKRVGMARDARVFSEDHTPFPEFPGK